MNRLLARTLAVAAAAPLALGLLPGDSALATDCTDTVDEALPLDVTVDGETAHGLYALPDTAPVGIVAFAHGYGHTSASWAHHLRRVATELDVITIAMDYRGIAITPPSTPNGLPSSRGWNVSAGAEDTLAATHLFDAACPTADLNVIHGVSMGGNTSGLVAAAGATGADGTPLFDYWVDIEGATNVTETYLAAVAIAPANSTGANAKADIEAEMGGTLAEQPATYRERSIVTRADDIKAGGIKGVVLVHGLDDGLVPYNQSREMAAALAAAGVPYDLYTVGRRNAQSEQDTTISGNVGSRVDPAYRSPLAGHASEKSTTNIVMTTGFERLAAIYADDVPTCTRESLVDGDLGTVPVAGTC